MSATRLLKTIKQALGIKSDPGPGVYPPDPSVYYHGNGEDDGELTVVIQVEGVDIERAIQFGRDLDNSEVVGIGFAERTDDGEIVEQWVSTVGLPDRVLDTEEADR